MTGARLNRNTLVLAGIGLVLVGLLAGILVMLFVVDARPASTAAPRQLAAQVELGARDAVQPVRVPEVDRADLPAEVTTLNRLFREVASNVTPAVVYIQVEMPAGEGMPREWFHKFEGEQQPGERFFREPAPRQSVGSGVVISRDGFIITNNHVVEGATDILVTMTDKRQFKARVVGADPATDLAVIKVEGRRDLPVIRFGDSDDVQVGDWAVAVGNPFRLTSTVTAGIISALGRQVNIIEDSFGIEDFIQTDAAINPGNSGGALVNLSGDLIGISTAIATESGSYEGYGFAVPVNLMARVAEDLIAFGEVRRGFLGVTIEEVGAREAELLGLDQIGGVYLQDVRRDGAAHRAGLRKGDVVLSIDTRPVDAPNELQRTIARYRPGDLLDIEVWRRGRRQQFQVELLGHDDPAYEGWFSEFRREEPMPSEPEALEPENLEMDAWGLGVRDITRRERDAFQVAEGAYVAYVKKGGAGHEAGLPRDVVVLSVDGQAVASAKDVARLLREVAQTGETVLVRVKRRDGLTAFYELEVPPAG